MWYPGQEGGPATADVLLGKADPGGKLPVTFPADATHFPTLRPELHRHLSHRQLPALPGRGRAQPVPAGATTSYRDHHRHGGQRHLRGLPLVRPAQRDAAVPLRLRPVLHPVRLLRPERAAPRDGGIDVRLRVTNVGDRAGADVPQVYIGPSAQLPAAIQQAVRKLVQFQRVQLAPGRSAELTLHVAPHDLSSWSSAQQKWVVGTGPRTVYAGPSSRDLPLHAIVRVTGNYSPIQPRPPPGSNSWRRPSVQPFPRTPTASWNSRSSRQASADTAPGEGKADRPGRGVLIRLGHWPPYDGPTAPGGRRRVNAAITLSSQWVGSSLLVSFCPGSRTSVRSLVDHAAEQHQGDHLEGHFEGQNSVSERQPESG